MKVSANCAKLNGTNDLFLKKYTQQKKKSQNHEEFKITQLKGTLNQERTLFVNTEGNSLEYWCLIVVV